MSLPSNLLAFWPPSLEWWKVCRLCGSPLSGEQIHNQSKFDSDACAAEYDKMLDAAPSYEQGEQVEPEEDSRG